jgi:hypothetical protein
VPFVFGSVALAVLGNAVYSILTNALGTTQRPQVVIAATALMLLAAAVWLVSRVIGRLRPAPPLANKRSPQPHKGLILLVSNEPVARKGLDWHKPKLENVWLVCSGQSHALGSTLREELKASGTQASIVLIDDVFDVTEVRDKVGHIYDRLSEETELTSNEVILDFTGMTATASVGSALACMAPDRPLQYTPATYDTHLNALVPRDPIEVVLDWPVASG